MNSPSWELDHFSFMYNTYYMIKCQIHPEGRIFRVAQRTEPYSVPNKNREIFEWVKVEGQKQSIEENV